MIFPIALDDSRVQRLPWVSITLAAVMVLSLVAWEMRPKDNGQVRQDLHQIFQFWTAHPELDMPKPIADRLPHRLTDMLAQAGIAQPTPKADQGHIDELKAQLDAMVKKFRADMQDTFWHVWGLVPAKGFFQRGWFTHIFLHAGWLHLIGNLFFFYLVGPYIEDVWGRPLFAAFFLVGGLFAAACQFALDPSSSVPMIGASGAIAACMGAFALRFRKRRIKFVYWLFFSFYGTFLVPAWIYLLAWFGEQILALSALGGGAGVAFAAHVGGFGFGLGVAALMGMLGIERKHIAPKLDRIDGFVQDAAVDRAHDALARGDVVSAKGSFQAALTRDPANVDALLGLSRLAFEGGDKRMGTRHADKLLTGALTRHDDELVMLVANEMGNLLDPSCLRPATAYRTAEIVDQMIGPEAAEPFYAIAGKGQGALAAKALLRAAEINSERLFKPEVARAQAGEVRSRADVDPALKARAEEILGSLRDLPSTEAVAAAMPGPLDGGVAATFATGFLGESASSALPPRAVWSRFAGRTADGYHIMLAGDRARQITRAGVPLVAAGMIATLETEAGTHRSVVVLDLIVRPGDLTEGPRILRFGSHAMGLETLFHEGTAPPAAFAALVGELTGAGADARPPSLPAGLVTYPDLASFEKATYGATSG